MNKVFVLREEKYVQAVRSWSKCDTGMSPIVFEENTVIAGNRNIRNYIDSFLRQTTYNVETIGSIEFALNRFVEYLENIEDFEDTKLEVINKEEIIDPIEDRFDILDL